MNFSTTFNAAFAVLNKNNFVSLVDLRKAMPHVTRADFDRGLYELRLSGLYDLSAAEGRFGLTAEERNAGISDGDCLLLFCHKA